MNRVVMALVALGVALSVAGCDSAGFATPAPRYNAGVSRINPMAGGGG